MAVALDIGSYSPISDYTSLLDNVKLWLDRGDELNVYLPTFVTLAEAYLNRTLRTPEMEATVLPAVTNGGFMLPVDCLAVRGVAANGRPLASTSPAEQAQRFGALTGEAATYAVSGRSVVTAPIGTEPLALSYWQRIPSLSLNAPTNWLLDGHPDIYLYGTLVQAEAYIDNPDRIAQWQTAFDGTIGQLVEAGNKARWGGPIVARSPVRSISGVRA